MDQTTVGAFLQYFFMPETKGKVCINLLTLAGISADLPVLGRNYSSFRRRQGAADVDEGPCEREGHSRTC